MLRNYRAPASLESQLLAYSVSGRLVMDSAGLDYTDWLRAGVLSALCVLIDV